MPSVEMNFLMLPRSPSDGTAQSFIGGFPSGIRQRRADGAIPRPEDPHALTCTSQPFAIICSILLKHRLR